jgi:hypothetical protein
MTSEFHPEVPQMLRGFGETRGKLGQPQWELSFDELAVSFESAETSQERGRLAEQGLAHFTRPHGLNDWLITFKSMPDQELYRIFEAHWMIIREMLKRL